MSLAAFQLKQVCKHLPHRPLSLWDSEYGCASFVLKTADIQADKLMRLHSNRNLWGAPPPYSGWGRPRLHGDCFKLNDPTTWRDADQDLTVVHPKLGSVRVRAWHQMHFRQAAKHPMTLIQVQRLDETGQPRSTRPLWLVWVGDTRSLNSNFVEGRFLRSATAAVRLGGSRPVGDASLELREG
jgi:hypothetical protein